MGRIERLKDRFKETLADGKIDSLNEGQIEI